jgi:hypothetical protein
MGCHFLNPELSRLSERGAVLGGASFPVNPFDDQLQTAAMSGSSVRGPCRAH